MHAYILAFCGETVKAVSHRFVTLLTVAWLASQYEAMEFKTTVLAASQSSW